MYRWGKILFGNATPTRFVRAILRHIIKITYPNARFEFPFMLRRASHANYCDLGHTISSWAAHVAYAQSAALPKPMSAP